MHKDLLHKIFVSLRDIKHELYAKSFQVNDIRENLPLHVETHVENLKRDVNTGHVTSSRRGSRETRI